jgi:hypothetical protein
MRWKTVIGPSLLTSRASEISPGLKEEIKSRILRDMHVLEKVNGQMLLEKIADNNKVFLLLVPSWNCINKQKTKKSFQ